VPEAKHSQRSINDVLVDSGAQLRNISPTPALDAQVLLAHALGQSRTWLIAHARDSVPDDQLEVFNKLIDRRASGEPIAYLTGVQEFWSLPMNVTADTLIPRPETELLVELALEKIPRDLIFGRFQVKIHELSLEATAWGNVFDPNIHTMKTEIKAVTYHQLEVARSDQGWQAQVIFDI